MRLFWKRNIGFGDTYGVLDGQYKGHTLMFIKKHGDAYGFCDIFDGKMESRWISKKDFDFGVKIGILELANPQPSKSEKNEIKKITAPKFNKEGKL
jgi:hypothetical protein